jgi:hypothetical protein
MFFKFVDTSDTLCVINMDHFVAMQLVDKDLWVLYLENMEEPIELDGGIANELLLNLSITELT